MISKLFSKMTTLDKYILRQVIEMFIAGVFIFTSIIFASDTFITLIKQISLYGIPFKVALMIIILNLPAVFVMTIPMGVLLATVMTLNKLSLASEITVMRSCGIGLNRIAKPIFIFATIMSLFSFGINETIVPVTTKQSKDLALWALGQKNIPEGKENFIFKELHNNGTLKRLFYVGNCKDKILHNITVMDMSKPDTIQVLQAQDGATSPSGWEFNRGAIYTVAKEGKILNTTFFENSTAQFGIDLSRELNQSVAKEHNFASLVKYIMTNRTKISEPKKYLYDCSIRQNCTSADDNSACSARGSARDNSTESPLQQGIFVQYFNHFCLLSDKSTFHILRRSRLAIAFLCSMEREFNPIRNRRIIILQKSLYNNLKN